MIEFTDDYKKYVQSPAWKRKRAQYWASVGIKRCQACGSRKNLHVHHKTYERFKRELLTDLCGLCQTCHRAVHRMQRASNRPLSLVTDSYVMKMRKTDTLRKKQQ